MSSDKQDASAPAEERPSSVVYQRNKQTKASVIWADLIAKNVIRVGGALVIVAVFTIMIFLFYVAAPLLNAGSVTSANSYAFTGAEKTYVAARIDEYRTMSVSVEATGALEAFHVGTGKKLQAPAFDLGGQTATAFAQTLLGDDVLFGFGDGTIRTGRFEIKPQILDGKALPSGLQRLDQRDLTDGTNVYSRISDTQFRRMTITLSLDAPVQVAPAGTAIVMADFRVGGTAERPLRTFVTLDAADHLRLSQANSVINMMTGETTTELSNAELPVGKQAAKISVLLLNTPGDRVIIGTVDGTILRFDTRNFAAPRLAETTRVLPAGVQLTVLRYLNAEISLVVGGSDRSLAIWFGVDRQTKATADGIVLTKVHADFEPQPAQITDVQVSQRTRMFTTTDADGHIWVRHATTERTLLKLPDGARKGGILATIFAPKDDAVLALGRNGTATLWGINVPHPETTLQSLFGKVWYEGYSEPQYNWQSTSGSDASEPKLSLIPLIFGTFKAAIYSLLLAIPIALFAAIYTSEFVHPNTRAVVKPVMELMASLPSVVIGFVAALVLSPIVENWIAAVVIAFAVVPLTLIASSYLWQLLPMSIATLLDGVPKLFAFFLAICAAIWLSIQAGPLIEILFFSGDFKRWTAGEGSGQPFLLLVMLPLGFLIAYLVTRPVFNQAYKSSLRDLSRGQAAMRELLSWLVLAGLGIATALVLSVVLTNVGLDARDGLVGTYVQRNALVAAFAIAFAEIPIIYTISEDALNAVPGYLRSGSLACGASRWQTASRIVLPTAASGIFSAIMIGLGRAVGETMIVLMATGNTPILDINIFNGLRTLSANINVELPEAVRDSTLYRTLFLCALVLFAMTFIINTIAEVVRQRYRRRAAQL